MLAAIKARFPPLVKHTVQDSTFSQNHAPSLHRVFVQSVLCAPLNPAPPSIHAPRSRRRCGPRPPPESAGNTTPARRGYRQKSAFRAEDRRAMTASAPAVRSKLPPAARASPQRPGGADWHNGRQQQYDQKHGNADLFHGTALFGYPLYCILRPRV